MSTSSLSPSSASALQYLKTKKPTDGWSVQSKKDSSNLVRLVRRAVPLTDSYFLDLHRDHSTGCVVGILTRPRNGQAQAQVLVNREGIPTGRMVELVPVSSWTPRQRAATTSTPASTTPSTTTTTSPLSDADNSALLRIAAGVFGALLALRVIAQAAAVLVLVFPLAYFYLVSTCPPISSFDAKRELKRVLRGHHLPDDHPSKPQGFFGETWKRFQASVTTELATVAGYEIATQNLAGAAIVAVVRVPVAKTTCYWVGAAHKWWYLYSTEIPDDE
jgi:hypothetical protein